MHMIDWCVRLLVPPRAGGYWLMSMPGVPVSDVVETTNVETETDNFFETKTEIETGKFRDPRPRPETIETKTDTETFYKKYSPFSIILKQ